MVYVAYLRIDERIYRVILHREHLSDITISIVIIIITKVTSLCSPV